MLHTHFYRDRTNLFYIVKILPKVVIVLLNNMNIYSLRQQLSSSLVHLDISFSNEVTDFGIQNLIFPPTIISNRGRMGSSVKVNLTNTRARTSQAAKVLQVSIHRQNKNTAKPY